MARSCGFLLLFTGLALTGGPGRAVDGLRAQEGKPARTDRHGDPLPEGALARLGTARFDPGNGISGVALSPDGKVLASGSEDMTVLIWESAVAK